MLKFLPTLQLSVLSTTDSFAPIAHFGTDIFPTSSMQVHFLGFDPTEGGVPERVGQGSALSNPDRG
jgi:hypothetical protein